MARAPAVQAVEEVPEWDRLEAFPHPRQTQVLYGHQRAEQELAGIVASGRIHHGWLICGASGIGKATLAYRFAKCLLADAESRQKGEGSLAIPPGSIVSRQVAVLSHPGLMVLRRPYDHKSKKFLSSIPVDEVRRLRSFLAHKAPGGGWRVVIVDSADDLNVNAANALLKSLEEPPARMVFLLISSEPGRLLNTIRSRCRRLDLEALASTDLRQAAEAAYSSGGMEAPKEPEWEQLTALARGSVGRLISLHSGGGLELHAAIGQILGRLPDVTWGKMHDLAERLGTAAQEERYVLYHELLFDRLAQLVKAAAGVATEGDAGKLAGRIIQPHRLASWAALWETLVREEAEIRALNLDRKAFMIGTMERISAAVRAP